MGRGLCELCYQRERLAGRLGSYPTRLDANRNRGVELGKLYKDGETISSIASKINLPATTVWYVLRAAKVAMRKASRKVRFNDHAFDEINSEPSAYWLGFLFADGMVSRYRLTVELQIKDLDHLSAMGEFLGSNARMRFRSRDGTVRTVSAQYNSVYLANSLKDIGVIVGRDCLDKISEILPANLISHFIRGFFDGDGWIGDKYYSVAMWGQKNVLTWVDNAISVATGVPNRSIKYRHNIYSIRYDGRIIATSVARWIYSDATIYLARKHDRFIKWEI